MSFLIWDIDGTGPRGAPIYIYIIGLAKLVPVPNPTLKFKSLKLIILLLLGLDVLGSELLCLKHLTRLEATDLGKPFPNRNDLISVICV